MNIEIGAALFPEKEYILGIFVAVHVLPRSASKLVKKSRKFSFMLENLEENSWAKLSMVTVPRRVFFTALQWIAIAQGPKIYQKKAL